MYAFESPFLSGANSIPTLVARITFFRLPLRLNQLPTTVSDSPPLWPGTQREYTSAVSTKLNPAPTNASKIANDAASSAVQPKTFPPRQMGETSRPDPPSLRVFIRKDAPYSDLHLPPGQRLFSSQTYSYKPAASQSGCKAMVKSCVQAAVNTFGSSMVS